MMSKKHRSAFIGLLVWFGASFAASAEMPRLDLSIGIHRIKAEVAHTEANRQQGLMYRPAMAAQEGMLFVFEQSARFCMWMKNTYIPLSVAFIDDAGTILNIEDMAPQTEASHCAAKPARYALEMNRGWFAQRGIRAGSKVSGIERAPAAR